MKSRLHPRHLLTLSMLLLSSGCAYDYASGQAPYYPPGYDSGLGSGEYVQPGDLFGGQDVASVDVFLEPLSEYGRWVNSQYGRAFQPEAGQDYRPYVNGHWGEDRLWISEDPWGWATDHYGRWGFDDDFGWVWVPGTQWAPSWVAWREDPGQDVVGWAPIPPGVNYSIGIGFGSSTYYDDFNSWYGPSWVWVPRNNIYQRGFGGSILPWNYGRNYWRGSQWNYNSGWNGRPGYNRPGGWAPRNRDGQYRDNDRNGRPGYRQPDRRDDIRANQRPNYRQPYNRQSGNDGRDYNRACDAQPGQRPDGERARDSRRDGDNQRGYFDRRNRDGAAANGNLPTVYHGVNPAGQGRLERAQQGNMPPRQRNFIPAPQSGNIPPQAYGGGGRSGYGGGRNVGNTPTPPPVTYQRPPQTIVTPTPVPAYRAPPQQQAESPRPRRDDSGNHRNDATGRPRTQPN